ncbi:MAG: RHS repeat-associated core domain-containing protein [Lewinellaceae bacterium]|nr:RHS repeat-associated core domain-containing protein [Lewinellaceae bacterium]
MAFADFNEDSFIEIKDNPGTGENELEITQEAHYYPFGMRHLGPWYATVAPENKYLYNGKELNEDYGINLLDYGARWYDGALGRFTGVDPIADQFPWVSTYNYAENEPVNNVDLHGLQAVSAEIAMDRDVKDYVEGRIDDKEYWARAQARFQGGVAGLGGVGLGGLIKRGGQSLFGWAVSNPVTAVESANTLAGLVWGLGTDAEAPGAGDNIGRSIREVSELEGVRVLSDDLAAAIRGGSRYSIYGGIEKAGSNLVYIGTKDGLPYIGKTSTTITGRYPKVNKAPLPFTDYFNAPENRLLDIEAAIINFNGGPKGGKIANKYNSSGDVTKGEEWLDNNMPNWRARFGF